jgi:zinc transport system substrate-binding protein
MIRWTCAVILGATLILAVGCGTPDDPWTGDEGKARVVVTIAPLESFVRAVGGDRVAVRCLCTTTGPHHYQPDTRDARLLRRADLFLAVGLTLDETFANAMVRMARKPDLRYVELGETLPKESRLEMTHECCKNAEPGHAHQHGKWDPHVWLGTAQAVLLVEQIRDQLTEIDAPGKEGYAANAAAYVAKLHAFQTDGKKLLDGRSNRRIISFHEALGYLAKSFDLEIAAVIEQGPGDEPTAKDIKAIIQVCKDRDKPVAAIAVEPQYPGSSSAKIIQNDLKRQGIAIPLVSIDPLETAEASDLAREGGDWYLNRMRQNLDSLAKALPAKK